MNRYQVTAAMDGDVIVSREFKTLLAAQVFAATWSVGDFAVAIQPVKS